MPGLRELQAAFQARVLGAGTAVDASIRADDRADAAERLAIYVNAYRLRLTEVLGKDYPVLSTCMGEEGFDELARAYLIAYPSRHPSVRWFGHALAAFLREKAPWRDQPALAEMARFEWTQGEVCDAPDDTPVDARAVAVVPPAAWPSMRFELRAAVRFLDLAWNVAAVVRDFNDGGSVPAPERLPRARTWLVWRGTDMMIRWRVLENDEREALATLARGGTFGEACGRVVERTADGDPGLRAASLLKQWLSDELIANIAVAACD